MNNIIIEEYIIGWLNIEVRYYIDGESFGRVAYLPIAEYEEWALKNEFFGLKEIPVMIGDEEIGYTYSDVNYENYLTYYVDWAIKEHLIQFLTDNPHYKTYMPFYYKLWYSILTWWNTAFKTPQIR